ncbi:MAG TPA: hypothetical protein VE641_02870 [Chthoniobacterales bacterium]|jgi:hypothetical protein|nr:hypothetical protein [Chthoniobacterales bacterium]
MKWLERTAQGFNPGLASLVECPESGIRGSERPVESMRELRKHTGRTPLSGRILLHGYPGLKPWAILLGHFVAKKLALQMNPS